MPIYLGSTKEGTLYYGGTKIKEAYYGSTKVYSSGYPQGTVLFESSTPGTHTLMLEHAQTYNIVLVGGGGPGIDIGMGNYTYSGGSGSCIQGNIVLSEGIYQVVIGKGGTANGASSTAGGNTTFNNQIAGGATFGSKGSFYFHGFGGKYTITQEGLTGTNGNDGREFYMYNTGSGGSPVYGTYGKGGGIYRNSSGLHAENGGDGYAKITAV